MAKKSGLEKAGLVGAALIALGGLYALGTRAIEYTTQKTKIEREEQRLRHMESEARTPAVIPRVFDKRPPNKGDVISAYSNLRPNAVDFCRNFVNSLPPAPNHESVNVFNYPRIVHAAVATGFDKRKAVAYETEVLRKAKLTGTTPVTQYATEKDFNSLKAFFSKRENAPYEKMVQSIEKNHRSRHLQNLRWIEKKSIFWRERRRS